MTITEPDIAAVERAAAEHLDADAGHVEAGLEEAAANAGEELEEVQPGSPRLAVAVAFPTIGAAIMVGGIFIGVSPRIFTSVAGLLGIGLALGASRLRRAGVANGVIAGGIFLIGLLMVVPTGLDNLGSLTALVRSAAAEGDVRRPPVEFGPGWHAVTGWLMAIVGFSAAWIAMVLKKPSFGLLITLPVTVIAAISGPKAEAIPSGIAVLVLFAIGLGVLSSADALGEEDEKPPLSYELKRAGKGLVYIAIITAALVGLSQTPFLFPDTIIDPAQEAQKPKTVPLKDVEDRVLFEVESTVTGPWRIGSLDVYDGRDFRLPPFADNRLKDVPKSGVVNPRLRTGVNATFTVLGLQGAVLPTLPNTVGIIARGPRLAYDARNANIRLSQGQLTSGQSYTVAAAGIPKVTDLQNAATTVPPEMRQFTEVPAMPPAVADLVDRANEQFESKWDRFNFLRNYVLENVTAAGQGIPSSVPPEKVQDMLAGSKEASPFEIVAAQALLARWVGVPSRIGYGFDGGDEIDGRRQVRPRNGATFVEVYFPGYEWIPVIGTPRKAKPTVSGDPSQQQVNEQILPSNEIAVQVYVPVVTPPASILAQQITRSMLIAAVISSILGLLYVLFPLVRKSVLRSRRRAAARRLSPRARIALAYSEWRDLATDYGYGHGTDTPLGFLDRFVDDEEHRQFAWLVTRTQWGDLQDSNDEHLALTAEELSRALRRRLAQAHPATVRIIASLSRLSLRDPYAPQVHRSLSESRQKEPRRVPVPA